MINGRAAVSVIVPCRNEAAHVRAFLDSVLAQETGDLDWEVIVADGMSDDGTREILAEYAARHRRVRVIDNPEKIVSTALNRAVRAARGEIIIRMDAHTEYAPDYVRRCVATLRETGADNVGGPPRVRTRSFRERLFGAAYHSPFAVGGAKWHNADYQGPVDTVAFGCWRKSTLFRLGLFDETLVRNQDDELNLRLTRAGGKIWQSSGIVSWYTPRTSLSGLFRQQFQYGFWKVAVIRKHRLPASWRHLVPGAFVLANLALLLGSLGGALLGQGEWSRLALQGWLALLVTYGLASLAASCRASKRYGWLLLPLLPGIYATYHLGYGLGFLAGCAYWPFAGSTAAGLARPFSRITR